MKIQEKERFLYLQMVNKLKDNKSAKEQLRNQLQNLEVPDALGGSRQPSQSMDQWCSGV